VNQGDIDPPAGTPAPHADALQIVAGDHEAIRALLAAMASFDTQPTRAADRHALVARIGAMLHAHGEIETGILYPALSGHVDAALLGRALADHRDIDVLLQRLAGVDPDTDEFAEHFAELSGAVLAHLFEEERSLLPRAATLDLAALGARMLARRTELLAGQGED
jgi:Hemerythrin HHE cation binding domain